MCPKYLTYVDWVSVFIVACIFLNTVLLVACCSVPSMQKWIRNSLVGIVSRCGVDSPGTESWWAWNFLHLSRVAPGPIQPSVQWVLVLFPRSKAAGGHPHLALRLKKELYLYSWYEPSWPVLGNTLPCFSNTSDVPHSCDSCVSEHCMTNALQCARPLWTLLTKAVLWQTYCC
jgi:hypothetical protein